MSSQYNVTTTDGSSPKVINNAIKRKFNFKPLNKNVRDVTSSVNSGASCSSSSSSAQGSNTTTQLHQ